MSMNFFNWAYYSHFFFATVFAIFVFPGCGKKNNAELAGTYFKLAFLELNGDVESIHACKRSLAMIDKALTYQERPEFYAYKATLLFKINKFTESDIFFKKALNLKPEPILKAEIMNNYACLCAQRGDIVKAHDIFTLLASEASYQTPEVAFVNLGKLALKQKDLKAAKELFQRAVNVCPSYTDAHYYLAKIALLCGDTELAAREQSLVKSLENVNTP